MVKIKIVQIFVDVDLRKGPMALEELAGQKGGAVQQLSKGEVYLFLNSKRNIIKVLARQGLFCDRLPELETFDFRLRRDQIMGSIGKYFGLSWNITSDTYSDVRKEVERIRLEKIKKRKKVKKINNNKT